MKINLKRNLLLLTAILLITLAFYGCTGGQSTSPTSVPVEQTATQRTVEATNTPTAELRNTSTPTATPVSETLTDEPTATAEPTPTSTPEPTTTTDSGAATPTEEPTQNPGEQATPDPKPDCEEIAAFYGDVTVPDDTLFRQGEGFVKTWKVRNEGTCTWDSDYSLVFAGGAQMSGIAASPLPDAAPGDIVEISIDLTAPSRGGTYVGNWMFSDPYGEWFGVGATRKGEIWVRIAVNYITPEETGGGGTEPAACGAERNTAYESQVLSLINSARSSNGLPSLSLNGQLAAAALAHSEDMACNDFVDHTGTDGTLWYDRITREGYVYTAATENIYVGDPAFGGTPAGALDWWMNSQIHRENILSEDVTEIGIAYVYNASSSYGGYYTVVFARP
jgi:uncharacterized protein YkwD